MSGEPVVFNAPWGRLLTGASVGIALLVSGIMLISKAGGSALLLLLLIYVLAAPFIVRGYQITPDELVIIRPFWRTRFPLADFLSTESDIHLMKGTIRLCGNGGLLSFTGLYRNKKLGKYRAFINDWNKTVVLRFESRTIVVSPDHPEEFINAIKEQTGNVA